MSQSNQVAAVNGGGGGLGETESAFGLTLNSNFAERSLLQEIASKSFSNAAATSGGGNHPCQRASALGKRRDSSSGFQSGDHHMHSKSIRSQSSSRVEMVVR